jgi:tetratricopeptide (TPR) repeat protein
MNVFVRVMSAGTLALLFCAATGAFAAKSPELREGKQLYQAGRYREALEKLLVAAKKSPGQAEVHYLAGLARGRLGHHAQAIASFREAQRLDPQIRFTRKETFESKLDGALRAQARAERPVPSPPPVPSAFPRPASPEPAVIESAPSDSTGPLWAYILFGVCALFLVVSFVRERVTRIS